MNTLRAGQVALDPDLSGMPRLRFLRQIGAVALILNMSRIFFTTKAAPNDRELPFLLIYEQILLSYKQHTIEHNPVQYTGVVWLKSGLFFKFLGRLIYPFLNC